MIPQEKSSQLVDKLNALLRRVPSEFELAALRQEFNKIESAGLYTEAQELRGMLSAITGDFTALEKYYKAALKSSGNNPDIRLSYATSLANIHHFKDAINVINNLVDNYSDDIEILKKFLSIYSMGCDFNGAKLICDKLEKLGISKEDKSISSTIVNNNLNARVLADNSVNWEDYCDRYLAVADMLRSHNLKVYLHESDTTDESINIYFPLDVDLNTLIEIDSAITEAIANLPYSPVDDCVSFSCIILEDNSAIAA